MTRTRKKIIGALAAVIALFIAAALFLLSPVKTVQAERSSTAWTEIREIYNDSTKGFYEDNLKELYKALTGNDNFASVQSAANSGKTSDDFRSQNNGKNISVWFGGKKWDAVYLTKATNGDVILDLWQSADTVTTRAQFGKKAVMDSEHEDWAAAPDLNDTYHANMYSTSEIRVETLNAGGYYLTDKDTLVSEKQGQNSGNQYARFTMDGVANSLTAYIVKPSEVSYQANEFNATVSKDVSKQSKQGSDTENGTPYYLPNDAYGTPNTGGQWYSDDYGKLYTEKDSTRNNEAKYGAWQNDYLWLPSLTEVGSSSNAPGLWNTDLSLRSSATVDDTYFNTYGSFSWLRSGFCSNATYVGEKDYGYFFVYVMGTGGANADWTNIVTEMNLVRPALHLNLTAANGNIKSIWKNVGEIYQDGSGFNAANLKSLYTALTGTGSYGSVRTALSDGDKTSADFRANNDGQNVQVSFGGIKWDAVYLTKAKNGDFILDLWQSADNVTLTSQWAYRNSKPGNNPTDPYPNNMYSTSYIRAVTLNKGGYYSIDGSNLSAQQVKDKDNTYARFTMSDVADSLTAYIATPLQVGYQENEFDLATKYAMAQAESDYWYPNDAYGKSGEAKWNSDNTGQIHDFTDKGDSSKPETMYGAWKDDYLWLPSITEVGCDDKDGPNSKGKWKNGDGLWDTDASLRSTISKNGVDFTWTRSGDDNWSVNIYALTTEGKVIYGTSTVEQNLLVRPAIHLNLTAINNSLKEEVEVPTIFSKPYTGDNLTADLDGISPDINVVKNVGGTDVGTYDVILDLKSPDTLKWKGRYANDNSITLQFKIIPATNTWTDGGVTVDGGGWTYGDTGKLSAPSTFGNAEFTYYNDKNGVADTSPLGAQPTNAGTYWVKATVPALQSTKDTSQKNYDELVSEPVKFTIKQATANVTINTPQNAAYTGLEQPATVSISVTGAPQLIESDYKVSYKGTVETNTTPINADTYTVTVTLTGNAAINYKLDVNTATFTIAKAELTQPTGTKTLNETYNTSEHTIVISNFSSDKMTAALSDNTKSSFNNTTFTATKAGEYTLTITITDQSNYKWKGGDSEEQVVFKINITKATVDLPQGDSLTGQYKPEGYTVKISGYNSTLMKFATTGDGAGFAVDGALSYIYNFTAKNVGEYTLTISLKDTDDYEWADKASDPTFTINISKKELEKPTGSANGAYKGEDYVVTLSDYDNATMKTSDVPDGSTFKEDGGTWKFSARDVGTYSITISLKDTGNYKWIGEGADPEITITIGKTKLSFELKESSKTYTGTAHSNIDVDFDGYKETLTKGVDYTLSFAEIDGKLDGGFPKGAGKYTVTLTLTGAAAKDYNLEVTTATYEIAQADLTFFLKQATATYTGTSHSDIDVTFDGIQNNEEFTKGTHYDLSFVQSDTTAQLDGSLPKTVGKYAVTVTLKGERAKNYNVTTVSQTYEITKASITVSGDYKDGRVYNGEGYSQTLTASDKGLEIVMTAADPMFAVTVKTARNAGGYTGENVDVTYEYDKINFTLTSGSATYSVEILQAELTLSLTVVGGGKIYDGNDTATVTGAISKGVFGADNVTIAEIIANFEDKDVGRDKKITVAKVTLDGTEAGNYTVVLKDLPAITGNIDKATIDVVWSGYTGLVYDGNSKTIGAEATGVLKENVELIISYESDTPGVDFDEIPLNAGDYTATATTLNGNYALSGNTLTYTVAKQRVNAPTVESKVYNRAPQIADVEESSLYEVTENDGGTQVDDYNVKLTLTDGKNYKWVKDGTEYETAYIDLTFTITKATYDMSGVTFEDFSIIYDGEEHSIFIVGDLPFEEVTVRYENNGQTKVGNYTVTAIFAGDERNYNPIDSKQAILTILAVSHDLSAIAFEDVTVKYDGETHGIYIDGDLPTNVTVEYEGNGQVYPAIYAVIAIFSDPDGEFDRMTATLTILRTQTQTEPEEDSGSGESGGEGGSSEADVYIESEDGFDPTLELVVEKVEGVDRNYWAWGKDEVSQRYAVKLCKDGVEVPIEGKVTVRLLIPAAFRDKDFELMAVAKSGAASANYGRSGVQAVALGATEGATSVAFTRDGDYVIFETDGLSEYVFTSSYTPYFPIIISATCVLLADVAAMIFLTVVVKKKRNTKAR